jgi:hypothetical protein
MYPSSTHHFHTLSVPTLLRGFYLNTHAKRFGRFFTWVRQPTELQ